MRYATAADAVDVAPNGRRPVTWVPRRRGVAPARTVVAVDGAQSLYGRPRSFTWKSVGINARGRSRRLAKNYRNTREILDFAWEVAQEPVADDDEDSETHVRVRPER